jgi:hypothetical protein
MCNAPQGDYARKEVSTAKLHCANTLRQSADVAIQLNGAGARGMTFEDLPHEGVYS